MSDASPLSLLRRGWRALRRATLARSYEDDFPKSKWEELWRGGYSMDTAKEDSRFGVLLTMLPRYVGAGPLLDAGCGDGLFEARFRAISPVRMVAFDISEAAIAQARARNVPDCEFLCADTRTYRPTERYAVILLNESLFYIEDCLGAMRNLGQGLSRDGVFVVSMYDRPIVRRIWKQLAREYTWVQGVIVEDERTGAVWHVRAMRPKSPPA